MKIKCRKCNSTKVVKHGHQTRWRGGKSRKVQMYRCNNCGTQFYLKGT